MNKRPSQQILTEYALNYNRTGLAVHPIGYGGKNPLAEKWQEPPKLSEDDIRQVFELDIVTGIGFVSGSMSQNRCVLDFDQNWQTAIDLFLYDWDHLNTAPLISTAHNRRQLLFMVPDLPPSFTRATFTKQDMVIDFRGNSMNNLLPPSYHAKCQKSYCEGDNIYQWLVEPSESDWHSIPFQDIYKWLSEWAETVEESKEQVKIEPVELGNVDKIVASQNVTKAIDTARTLIRTAVDGQKHRKLLTASNLLGGYVAVGAVSVAAARDILRQEIENKPNVENLKLAYKTIDNGLEFGATRPFTAKKILSSQIEYATKMNGHQTVTPNGSTPAPATIKPLSTSDILEAEFPEPKWIIPGLLPIGLTIFGGRAKLGKSWLALQLAKAVSAGNSVLFGEILKEPKKTLYLALEDSPRRLQNRMKKQQWTSNQHAYFLTMTEFKDELGSLLAGGADKLAQLILKERFELTIVDTFTKACFHDQNKNELMAAILSPLQVLAMEQEFSLVVVDHHNKGTSSQDVIANIIGGTSKGGMVDTAMGLYRDRSSLNAELLATGRDIEDKNITLKFDKQTGLWVYEGDTYSVKLTQARKKYLSFLKDNGGKATAKQISNALDVSVSAVHKIMIPLINGQYVYQEYDSTATEYIYVLVGGDSDTLQKNS